MNNVRIDIISTQVKEGTGIRNLIGKYSVRGKKAQFKRAEFYDQLIKKEISP